MAASKDDKNYQILATNRRARRDYELENEVECGIVLVGSEVKSLRSGRASIAESYAAVEHGELWLINSTIAAHQDSGQFNHEEKRKRKLLVKQRELAKFWSATKREGMTLVPLVMYFNHAGRVKVKLAVAKGRKRFDKRQLEKRRDWGREKARLLRQSG